MNYETTSLWEKCPAKMTGGVVGFSFVDGHIFTQGIQVFLNAKMCYLQNFFNWKVEEVLKIEYFVVFSPKSRSSSGLFKVRISLRADRLNRLHQPDDGRSE